MKYGTKHMGGMTTGAARLGDACAARKIRTGIAVPFAATSWHVPTLEQVSPVFATDRPTPRPLERWP